MHCGKLIFLVMLSLSDIASAHQSSSHDQHVVFQNSAADRGYYHSQGTVVAPSELEIADGKFPVERQRFLSPSNCLRLHWKSAPGGDWQMKLNMATRYGRRFDLSGDTLSLWCFSEEALTPENGPRVFVQDAAGAGVPTIPLLAHHGPLPAGRWVQVRLPFAKFAGQYQGTDDNKFNSRQLASVTFIQGLDDGEEHTLFIDDVSVLDAAADETVQLALYSAAFAGAAVVFRHGPIRRAAPVALLAGVGVVAVYALAARLLPDVL